LEKPLAILVDDDASTRSALKSYLAAEDIAAEEAADGLAALELLRRLGPDFAFVDVQLPLLDGISWLKMARDLKPLMPVVMMSGTPAPGVILAALENGAYSFLPKPCDLDQVVRIVHELLTKELPTAYRRVRVSAFVPEPDRSRGDEGARVPAETKGGPGMAIVRWSPFRELVSLQQDMNRLFGDLITQPAESGGEVAVWVPAVDVSEDGDNITVKVEVPGVKKDDIKISVVNNVLSIKGEKRMETETKEKNFHRVERVYGAFFRSLELPGPVIADKVKANYADGVLVITLPKSEETKPKEIPIET
jgi:HSP20 family protein